MAIAGVRLVAHGGLGPPTLAVFRVSSFGFDVVNRHGVHVVNQNLVVDVVICYTKVTTIVSSNDVVSNLTPLLRSIEPLVDMTVKTKR